MSQGPNLLHGLREYEMPMTCFASIHASVRASPFAGTSSVTKEKAHD